LQWGRLFFHSRQHNNPRLRDGVPFSPVLIQVVSILFAMRSHHVLVDDRPPDPGMPADGDIVKENRVLYQAETVDNIFLTFT
jgi:hypothetical protein